LDHKAWYNRKELILENLVDLTFLSAMGPPGGGKTRISDRMCRHYNILAYTEVNDETIRQIYSAMCSSYLANFADDVRAQVGTTVEAVINTYNAVKSKLKPTPSKSHYTFNLRDVAKVF